jgi:hypothetical protein
MRSVASLLLLVELTGASGESIVLNSDAVVTIRAPRRSDHFAPGMQCLITTSDGKYVAVRQQCHTVRELIDADKGSSR